MVTALSLLKLGFWTSFSMFALVSGAETTEDFRAIQCCCARSKLQRPSNDLGETSENLNVFIKQIKRAQCQQNDKEFETNCVVTA